MAMVFTFRLISIYAVILGLNTTFGGASFCPANFGSSFDYDRCLAETQNFECFRNDVATNFGFLDQRSVVVVIGAYKGENVQLIASNNEYPNLVLFEPIPEFAQVLRQKFSQYPNRVDVFDTAIGIANKTAFISLDSDASSVVAEGKGDSIAIKVSTFNGYFADIKQYGKIDLLYVNCEGCEYEFLTDILKHGWQERIDNLLLQFHYQSDGYSKARCPLLHILSSSHHRAFSYPWVWELWARKSRYDLDKHMTWTVFDKVLALSSGYLVGASGILAAGIVGIWGLPRRTRKARLPARRRKAS